MSLGTDIIGASLFTNIVLVIQIFNERKQKNPNSSSETYTWSCHVGSGTRAAKVFKNGRESLGMLLLRFWTCYMIFKNGGFYLKNLKHTWITHRLNFIILLFSQSKRISRDNDFTIVLALNRIAALYAFSLEMLHAT